MHVLVICNRLAPTIELAHVIRALPRVSGLRPLALLGSPQLKHSLSPGLLGGAQEYLLTKEIVRPLQLHTGRLHNLAARAARAFRLDVLADYLLILRAAAIGERALQKILEKHPDIGAVVTADDRSLGFEFGIVHAARRRGIASLTIPFALSDPGGDWLRRSERSEFSLSTGPEWTRRLKRKLANEYPANIRSQSGSQLMFLTAGQVLGLRHLGGLFPVPWAYGGGATDAAVVFSRAIRNKQVSLGVPEAKLIVTGQPATDELCAASLKKQDLKQEIFRKYGFAEGSRLIILAVPQHAEHGMMQASEHEPMTRKLFQDVRATGASVLLSLHPRSRRSDYQAMADSCGARIAESPLLEVLPAADLFVATHSSTVRWAILLKTPTIVLDDFGVGSNGMFGASALTFVTDRSAVRQEAERLLTEARQPAGQSGQDPDEEIMDGFSSRRVASVLERLCRPFGVSKLI